MTSKKEFNEIIAKSMVDDINLLSPQDHNQILTFIKNDGVKYMENENGVFIKMNQLKMSTIESIRDYIDSLKETDAFVKNTSLEMSNNLESVLQNSISSEVEDVEKVKNLKPSGKGNKKTTKKGDFAIEQWKKDVICKMKDDVKQKLKRTSGKQNSKTKTVEKMM